MLFKDISIVDKDFEVKHHMYVMTKGAHIVYVGDKDPASLDTVDTAGQEICDGDLKLLMPAFYNTHCHVPMTLLRGYGEGLPLQRWLNEKIFPFEAKFLPPEKYAGAALGSLELLKSGCVSISDMYFDLPEYGLGEIEAETACVAIWFISKSGFLSASLIPLSLMDATAAAMLMPPAARKMSAVVYLSVGQVRRASFRLFVQAHEPEIHRRS